MANYRNISVRFWTDSKIDDDFTPEDKYFYLYLLTNPHTNICGCYEISMKQMERETGYNNDTIMRLLKRMQEVHNVIRYCKDTREILVLHWYKYNWSKSENVRKALSGVLEHIKHTAFKIYVIDRVSIWYGYHIEPSVTDTVTETVTETETETVTETVSVSEYSNSDISGKPQKHKHGEFNHVLLTDDEYSRLCDDYGPATADLYIKKVDEYCEQSGKRYKNYNLAIRNTFMGRDNVKPVKKNTDPGYDPVNGWRTDF